MSENYYMNETNNQEEKRKNMKNIYLVVLAIVTVLAICIGVGIRVLRWGGSFSKNVEEGTISLESFSKIDIDVDMTELSLVEGSEYKITYAYPEKMIPKAKVEGNTLKITQKSSGRGFSFGNVKCDLIIEIPVGASITELSCKAAAGNIEMGNLSMEKLTLDMDAGNIEIADSTFDEVTLKADAGNVELTNVNVMKTNMSADAGNVETNGGYIGDAQLSADLGNVEVNSEFESLVMDCSLGEISVKSDSVADGKKMQLETELGKVIVNDQDHGTKYIQ